MYSSQKLIPDGDLDTYIINLEENNRMGKTRDLFKKIRDSKVTFHAKMGTIHYGEHCGYPLKKLEIELLYDPAIPLLGIHTEETRIERDTCTPVFMQHCLQ